MRGETDWRTCTCGTLFAAGGAHISMLVGMGRDLGRHRQANGACNATSKMAGVNNPSHAAHCGADTEGSMENAAPWWLGNPIAILVFVLISSIITLAIGGRRRGEVQFWRIIETATTILGGLSLLLLSINVEHTVALRYFDMFRQSYVGASARLLSHVDFVPRYMCDTRSARADASAKDFDDIVADQVRMCEWSKGIKAIVNKVNFENLDPIAKSWFLPPTQKTGAWTEYLIPYNDGADDYIKFRNSALMLRRRSGINNVELNIVAFAPYFLGFAFAMQLARVVYK